MPARKPDDLHRLIEKAVNAGDIDGAMSLYEAGAAFVPQPGEVVVGSGPIREALQGFIALKPALKIQTKRVIEGGDSALLIAEWTLKGTGPDGKPVEMGGKATDVARRQRDGTWRYIIDDPFGWH